MQEPVVGLYHHDGSAWVLDPSTATLLLRVVSVQLFVSKAIQGEGHSKQGLDAIICVTRGLAVLSAYPLHLFL